jgi:hypothetical protein
MLKPETGLYSKNIKHGHLSMRFLCYLFASLIQIILHWQIYNYVQEIIWKKKNRLISLIKFSKTMSHFIVILTGLLSKKRNALEGLLDILIIHSEQFLYR